MSDVKGKISDKMILTEVITWLRNRGMKNTADMIDQKYTYSEYTINGLIYKNIIKEILIAFDPSGKVFKDIEQDIQTHTIFTPDK